jgi:hypothetical protein
MYDAKRVVESKDLEVISYSVFRYTLAFHAMEIGGN